MFHATIVTFLLFFSHAALAAPEALPESASEKTSKSSRALSRRTSSSPRKVLAQKARSAVFEALASNVQTYDELLSAIRQTRAASAQRIEVLVEQEKLREAWETGKLIDEHILLHKERADYGEQVIERLAKDLGTSKRELHYMVEFARSYPIVPHAAQLSWSEYRDLLAVNDHEERRKLSEQAVQEKWDRDTLRREIKRRNLSLEDLPNEPLEAKPGKLHTYRVVRDFAGENKDELVIDLGFSNYLKPEKKLKLKDGDIVELVKGKLKKSKFLKESDLYTFEAEVIRVLDGDTFAASVDLGFGFTTVQTLRLRGLDAPEIQSADGKQAKAFVESEFAKARGKVLIKTVKSDKYDRYLADVFIPTSLRAPEGRSNPEYEYLNQKLIANGHAVRMSE